MRKVYAIWLALLGVFAFAAIAVGSASALELLWLVDGANVPAGGVASVTEGLLTLIHLEGGFLEPEAVIHCEGLFDGLVLPNGEDTVEALLNVAGEAIGPLPSTLECVNVKNCPTPLVVAQNFPWLTLLELMEVEGKEVWLDLFYTNNREALPGYEIICDGLGVETLCEGETSAKLELMEPEPGVIDLLGIFNAAELVAEKLEVLCILNGADHENAATQEGEGLLSTEEAGHTLDVSEN